MPTIDANGQTLYHEVHGEGEPLLCVHGPLARHARLAPRRCQPSRPATAP